MRMTRFALAGALLIASPAFAEEENPATVSEMAGTLAGVAESCGLSTKAYSSRVEALLRHMAGTSGDAAQLIASYKSKKKETMTQEQSERTIDCMDAKRRFEELPINQPRVDGRIRLALGIALIPARSDPICGPATGLAHRIRRSHAIPGMIELMEKIL